MADRSLLRRVILRSTPLGTVFALGKSRVLTCEEGRHLYSSTGCEKKLEPENEKTTISKKGNWYALPPFTPSVDGAALGKTIAHRQTEKKHKASDTTSTSTMTALKWVTRCCPELPRSLVQKLFRLRQVRRDSYNVEVQQRQLKRVAAKDLMNSGDRIVLPVSIQKVPSAKTDSTFSEEEMKFLHSMVLFKDPAVIVVNKPPGMPVQGGIGIKRSLDELAAKYLRFDDSESPRLVHRLDRDCSGILVMGRTQLSATTLHSIFREKTLEASEYVVVDNGKSDRITVVDDVQSSLAQYAVTEYEVIGSSCYGYSWLELSPLTGRKHQLRVHCAEVLGTPIVGDYKYGWQAHRNLKNPGPSALTWDHNEGLPEEGLDPFSLNLGNGSILDKQPRLHLHCREMVLPNISLALQRAKSITDLDLEDVKTIKFDAPLPSHMQKSWDALGS
ncbi:RNA pseudouridine synthase 4, mitochondrial isoform X2 [Coffea eugenioides]|uniref:RNA pseudouridine synthase 4, mitochondrial isoform X2 n=1 Tax=Coffea eugenioides TaxID=49369 RepID=UPI000F606A91|nr:RNA pseudouridine synthase 4, mitochondrial isoform X2 [Coffea eugenioides]